MRLAIGAALLSAGSLLAACPRGAGSGDGGTQPLPLATSLKSETDGQAAAQAFRDHATSAEEVAQSAVFLAHQTEGQGRVPWIPPSSSPTWLRRSNSWRCATRPSSQQ